MSVDFRNDPAYRTKGVVLELESCRAPEDDLEVAAGSRTNRPVVTASLAAIYSPYGISIGKVASLQYLLATNRVAGWVW
jgi:hypothetical protein